MVYISSLLLRNRKWKFISDIQSSIKNGKLTTDLYSKPADSHQFLHYDYCHAEDIKKSIIYSQTLSWRRICSNRKNLKSHKEDLKGWFPRKGYPQRIGKERIVSGNFFLEHDTQQIKKENGIPLVVTYNLALKSLFTVLWKNFNIL